MKYYYLTKNAAPLTFIEGSLDDVDNYLHEKYTNKEIDWKKSLTIRIYEYYIVTNNNNCTDIIVKNINKNTFKEPSNPTINWEINFNFKDENKRYSSKLYNSKGGSNKTVYVLWDIIDKVTNRNCKEECDNKDNIEFIINHYGKLTSHAVLTLFFQTKSNCKTWTYKELELAIYNENPLWNFRDYEDRGLGGERPREWKNHMGYEYITNDKDRNVPDGSIHINSPIPTIIRNERRNADFDLIKEDWSSVLSILEKNVKRLRCFFCGRFEGEINKINEKTTFQKGHLTSLTSGGDSSKDNILSQCQYCNNTLNDFFDFDELTLKMKVNPIKAIEKQNEDTRIEILRTLLNNMIKRDDKRVKEILIDFLKKR